MLTLFFMNIKKTKIRIIPVIVMLVSVAIVPFVPLRDIHAVLEFNISKQEYVSIVQDLENGKLEKYGKTASNSVEDYIVDYAQHKVKTAGGRIQKIETPNFEGVYFCKRSFLDNDSGYLHIKRDDASSNRTFNGDKTVFMGL